MICLVMYGISDMHYTLTNITLHVHLNKSTVCLFKIREFNELCNRAVVVYTRIVYVRISYIVIVYAYSNTYKKIFEYI